jgi:AcrR family transcriptional regulator
MVAQAPVEKLQVGKGTLYRHFPSKRDLFLATADRVMRRLRERIDADVAGIEDPLDRLTEAVRSFLGFFADHPEFVELLIQERAHSKNRKKPTYFEHLEKNKLRWGELFRSLIAEGRAGRAHHRRPEQHGLRGHVHQLLHRTEQARRGAGPGHPRPFLPRHPRARRVAEAARGRGLRTLTGLSSRQGSRQGDPLDPSHRDRRLIICVDLQDFLCFWVAVWPWGAGVRRRRR